MQEPKPKVKYKFEKDEYADYDHRVYVLPEQKEQIARKLKGMPSVTNIYKSITGAIEFKIHPLWDIDEVLVYIALYIVGLEVQDE